MIVLTGGAGFIGSCLLRKLNDENIKDILVVDHLGTSEKWRNLIGKKFTDFIHKDRFLESLDFYAKKYSITSILHLGACTVTTERDADYLIENNLNYSKQLAQFAVDNNVRFIYASSAASYGRGDQGYSDSEFNSLRPLNAYGLSKHLFDLWVNENHYDSVFTGIKFFNVFGPNEYHKGDMASMVYKSFCQILDGGKVRLFRSTHFDYKDGEQKRDFVYVKDVIEILWNIYNEPSISGIYNLGTGQAEIWKNLVTCVFNSMGLPVNIEYIDMPAPLITQYQNFTQAEMTRLSNANIKLKFNTLEESIKDYVQNYLSADWQYF